MRSSDGIRKFFGARLLLSQFLFSALGLWCYLGSEGSFALQTFVHIPFIQPDPK